MRPASSTATMRRSSTAPVSVSTSTTATCAPKGNVGASALKTSSARNSSSRPSAWRPAASSRPGDGGRGRADHVEAAGAHVEHDVVDVRLELLSGQLARALGHPMRRLRGRDAADLGRLRAVRAHTLPHLVGVSLDDAHRFEREPEPVRDDHRERRLVPLSVRERSGAQDGLAFGRDLDRPELRLHQAVRDLDVDADADAQRDRVARLAPPSLLVAERPVAGRLEREVERSLVVARVVVRARGGGEGERISGDEIATPHLGGVEPELGGEEIHGPLDRLRRLRSPGAAERPDRRRVGDDARELRLDRRDCVHTARHHGGEAREHGSDARICADVLEDAQAVGLDVSVAAPPDGEVEDGGATMGHRDHVLGAGLGPAHRAPGRACEPRDQDLLDGEELGSEPSSDVRCDDAHVGRFEAEAHRQAVAVLVRRLGREPQRQPPVVSDDGGARAGLERARREPLTDQALRHDRVAAVEQRLVRLDRMARADVRAGVGEEQHVSLERPRGVDHRGQRVVLDDDDLGGVDAVGAGLREHHGDDVPGEADDVPGEERSSHPLVETWERRRLERVKVDVGRREHLRSRKLRRR